MKKRWKVLIIGVSWVALNYIQGTIAPMFNADMAVTQLEDSDVAYAQFSGLQSALKHFWVLYLLPLAVFTKDIKKAFKK